MQQLPLHAHEWAGVQHHFRRWRVKIYYQYECIHLATYGSFEDACRHASWARVILGQHMLARSQRPPPFGLCLLTWRKVRHLSQVEMAFQSNLLFLDYLLYERGPSVPLPTVVDRLARTLALTVPQLLGNPLLVRPTATVAA